MGGVEFLRKTTKLKQVVLVNMQLSIAPITFSHQLMLSLAFITCGHHSQPSLTSIHSCKAAGADFSATEPGCAPEDSLITLRTSLGNFFFQKTLWIFHIFSDFGIQKLKRMRFQALPRWVFNRLPLLSFLQGAR